MHITASEQKRVQALIDAVTEYLAEMRQYTMAHIDEEKTEVDHIFDRFLEGLNKTHLLSGHRSH
jgi:hypothetical protein